MTNSILNLNEQLGNSEIQENVVEFDSRNLPESEKLTDDHPQLIMMVGLPRSGKSVVAEEIKRTYEEMGVKCKYLSTDIVRKPLITEINQQLLTEGYNAGTDAYETERRNRLYSEENKQFIYDAMYQIAGEYMRDEGGIVIFDGLHVTEEKRDTTLKGVKKVFGSEQPAVLRIIEVANSEEKASQIFEADAERYKRVVRGLAEPGDDLSEAHQGIREREKDRYEPIKQPHIKIVNDYESADALARHVRDNLFPKKAI